MEKQQTERVSIVWNVYWTGSGVKVNGLLSACEAGWGSLDDVLEPLHPEHDIHLETASGLLISMNHVQISTLSTVWF